jgi:hypothetical protein
MFDDPSLCYQHPGRLTGKPYLTQEDKRQEDSQRNDRNHTRVYDRTHKDYHDWNENEDRSYRQYQGQNQQDFREYHKLNPEQQDQYWNSRHSHPEPDQEKH